MNRRTEALGAETGTVDLAIRSRNKARRTRLLWILPLVAVLLVPAWYYFGTGDRADADAVWNGAEADFNAGRFEQAEAGVRRLERLRAPTPIDRMLRAQVDLARNRPEDGLGELSLVPDDHFMAAQARMMSGKIELRRHRARLAEKYFREALRLDPTLAPAHRELIYILGYQLRRAELNLEFRALSEVSEMTFDNAFHWCLLRTASWEPGTALKELAEFVQADPEDRWSRLAMAENHRRMGLLDEAAAIIAPLPEEDPEAIQLRAMLAIDRHREDEAERLLGLGPRDHAGLATLRGRLALARRDGPAAAREFRTALQGAYDQREPLFGLINALTMMGRDAETGPLRETARKLDALNSLIQRAATTAGRQDPRLLKELGEVCAGLNFRAEARVWYRLAIARDPLDTEAQQALYRLQTPGEGSSTPGLGEGSIPGARDRDEISSQR
jgi:tetratricopeptide (TPR) repeat protein